MSSWGSALPGEDHFSEKDPAIRALLFADLGMSAASGISLMRAQGFSSEIEAGVAFRP